MKSAKDKADDTPGPFGRFLLGFALGGGITFFSIFLRGRSFSEALGEATALALLVGLVVGALSVFGKRIYQFFAAWFTHMPW